MGRSWKWSRIGGSAQLMAITSLFASMLIVTACGEDPPPPPIPLEERTPKVLLIGIDGVRPDVLGDVDTPNLDGLAARGFFTGRTRTTTPSLSGPAWSSMLTGVWPEKHGVTDDDFVGSNFEAFPDFLTRIEQVRPDLSTFAVANWLPLMEVEGGDPVIGRTIDARHILDGSEGGWVDADTRSVGLAIEALSNDDPDAMFVYLGNPDEQSHQAGSIDSEYRNALALADRHVGMLVQAIGERPSFRTENWLVLVSTDHGRLPDGDHGGDSPVEMTTFILASGPSAALGGAGETTYIVDVSVTALSHLGIEAEPAWDLDGRRVGLR